VHVPRSHASPPSPLLDDREAASGEVPGQQDPAQEIEVVEDRNARRVDVRRFHGGQIRHEARVPRRLVMSQQ
jgi:hypothetical protein